jgi:hypothetical protein
MDSESRDQNAHAVTRKIHGERCALDAADAGPLTLDQIGMRLGRTRERIRQIERKALRKIAVLAPEMRELFEACVVNKPEGQTYPAPLFGGPKRQPKAKVRSTPCVW